MNQIYTKMLHSFIILFPQLFLTRSVVDRTNCCRILPNAVYRSSHLCTEVAIHRWLRRIQNPIKSLRRTSIWDVWLDSEYASGCSSEDIPYKEFHIIYRKTPALKKATIAGFSLWFFRNFTKQLLYRTPMFVCQCFYHFFFYYCSIVLFDHSSRFIENRFRVIEYIWNKRTQ